MVGLMCLNYGGSKFSHERIYLRQEGDDFGTADYLSVYKEDYFKSYKYIFVTFWKE